MIRIHLKGKDNIILMPPKKDKQSDVEPKKNAKKVQKEEVVEQQDNTQDNTQDNQDNKMNFGKKKVVQKPGRTILVSAASGSSVNESIITNAAGLNSHFVTKNGSYVLEFDTVENAEIYHNKISQEHPNLKDKYSGYQMFFTVKGITNDTDYTSAKKLFVEYIEKIGGKVLYFKLYRKGDNYFFDTKGDEPIGYGDLTVDTKGTMDALLNKEGLLKNYTLHLDAKDITVEKDGKKETISKGPIDITGTFYRFNKNPKNDTNQKPAYLG